MNRHKIMQMPQVFEIGKATTDLYPPNRDLVRSLGRVWPVSQSRAFAAQALLSLLVFIVGQGAELPQLFLDNAFENTLSTQGSSVFPGSNSPASIWAGGNVGPYPGAGGVVPQAISQISGTETTVMLQQSSIGQIVAGSIGFPGAAELLLSTGKQLRDSGAAYRYVSLQTGQGNIGGGAWDIVFPGVVDQSSGQVWNSAGSTKAQNFFEDKLLAAAEAYRAVLHSNPLHVDAARGLLNTVYERVVPLTFAGNNAFVQATKLRLTSQGSSLSETTLLETNALHWFRESARVVIGALNTMPEATFLDGSSKYVSPSELLDEIEPLNSAYVRAVVLQGETLTRLARLKYLQDYRPPDDPQFNPTQLTSLIETNVTRLRHQILLANLFLKNNSLPVVELPAAELAIQGLLDLRISISQGRISFVGERITTNGIPLGLTVSDYSPEYVPFLFDPQEFASFNSSFAKLSSIAKDLATQSAALDNSLINQNRQFDSDLFQLTNNVANIRTRYVQELGEICGWLRASNGTLNPDLLFASLPPVEREKQHRYGAGESKGQIYLQWQKVLQAETDLKAAKLDLDSNYAQIQKKQDVANQVAQGFTNIARIILENGEKLAALDVESGEIQAMTLRTTTRIQNQAAVNGAVLDALRQVPQTIVTAVASGGVSLLADGASLASTAGKLYINVQAATRIAEIQGDSYRKLGQIAAQKERIAALERAQIQYEQAHQELLKTEEAVFAMMLQAERLKLNILMAEQRLDMAMGELANTTARIQFLLQELQYALSLELSNPLRNPDFRLQRDLATRQAEETFASAQEWAYLAGKAALYKVNGSLRSSIVASLVNSVLQARNGTQLRDRVQQMEQQIDKLYLEQGTQTAIQVATISVRNFIVQNNSVVLNAQGDPDPKQSVFEPIGNGQTSDSAWIDFLRDHLVRDSRTGELKLEFAFSTSLDRQSQTNGLPSLQARRNPLFNTTMFNALITYANGLPNALGVRVNLRGRSLSLDPAFPIVVDLRQEGASYVRSRSWVSDPRSMNVWNLKQTLGQVTASINGFSNVGSPQFHERSPANDRWVFTASSENGGNQALLNQLDKISDIELAFSIRGFTGGQ